MPLLYLDRKDFMSFMKKQATELAQIETQITQIKRQNKKAKIDSDLILQKDDAALSS